METTNPLFDFFYRIWGIWESDMQLLIVLSLSLVLLASILIFVNERIKRKKYLKKHDGVIIKKQKDTSHLKKIEESRLKNQNLFRNKNRI